VPIASTPPSAAPAPPPSASVASRPPVLTPTGFEPPEKPSKPPTPAEWAKASEEEVRNAKKLGCETKFVREWLRVSCRAGEDKQSQITGLKWIEPGKKPADFYELVKANSVASVVFPIRKDTSVRVEFSWTNNPANDTGGFSRLLIVSWKAGLPKPAVYFNQASPKDLSKPACTAVCGLPFFPGRGTMPCPPGMIPDGDPEVNGCVCVAYAQHTCAIDW
jgi:hypothetical protein